MQTFPAIVVPFTLGLNEFSSTFLISLENKRFFEDFPEDTPLIMGALDRPCVHKTSSFANFLQLSGGAR